MKLTPCVRVAHYRSILLVVSYWLGLSAACEADFLLKETDNAIELRFTGLEPNEPNLSRPPVSLLSPAGNLYVSDPGAMGPTGVLLGQFDTLRQALDYLNGSWQVTLSPSRRHTTKDTFTINIGQIPDDTFPREPPQLVTPTPGAKIINGDTFLLAWDYPSDADADRSRVTFTPDFALPPGSPPAGGGSFGASRPSPGSSSSGSGSSLTSKTSFKLKHSSVPDADDYEFLVSMEIGGSAGTLPRRVDLQIESVVDLSGHLSIGDTDGLGVVVSPFDYEVFYGRPGEPFSLVLTSVPEPSTLLLILMACAPVAAAVRRR